MLSKYCWDSGMSPSLYFSHIAHDTIPFFAEVVAEWSSHSSRYRKVPGSNPASHLKLLLSAPMTLVVDATLKVD